MGEGFCGGVGKVMDGGVMGLLETERSCEWYREFAEGLGRVGMR